MLAGVAVISWLVGLLMGLALGSVAAKRRAADDGIDELVRRTRRPGAAAGAAAAQTAPGAPAARG